MDCSLRHFRRLPSPVADVASPRLADLVQYPRPRRVDRVLHREKDAAYLDGRCWIDHPLDWNLHQRFDPDDGPTADPHRTRNDRGDSPRDGGVKGMAVETAAAEIGFERAPCDQPAGIGEAATRHRKAVEEKRRRDAGTGGRGDSAGRISKPPEAEGGRHDGAAERAAEKETIAGRIARIGNESESAGWPNE